MGTKDKCSFKHISIKLLNTLKTRFIIIRNGTWSLHWEGKHYIMTFKYKTHISFNLWDSWIFFFFEYGLWIFDMYKYIKKTRYGRDIFMLILVSMSSMDKVKLIVNFALFSLNVQIYNLCIFSWWGGSWWTLAADEPYLWLMLQGVELGESEDFVAVVYTLCWSGSC